METQELGKDFKEIEIDTTTEQKNTLNQVYINDLAKIKQHISTTPDYTPKKLIDQFSLVDDGSEKSLYVNINNVWTKIGQQDLSGYVPTTRTVNGHALSSDVVVTADDIGVQILGAEASDTLQYSLDTERTVNGNVGGICKSIKLNVAGVVRVSWETRSKVGFTGQGGYLLLNGDVIQSPTNTTSYQTLTIDVAVGFGDVLALSGQNVGSANYEKYFKNFRIYYTPTDINNQTITDTSL